MQRFAVLRARAAPGLRLSAIDCRAFCERGGQAAAGIEPATAWQAAGVNGQSPFNITARCLAVPRSQLSCCAQHDPRAVRARCMQRSVMSGAPAACTCAACWRTLHTQSESARPRLAPSPREKNQSPRPPARPALRAPLRALAPVRPRGAPRSSLVAAVAAKGATSVANSRETVSKPANRPSSSKAARQDRAGATQIERSISQHPPKLHRARSRPRARRRRPDRVHPRSPRSRCVHRSLAQIARAGKNAPLGKKRIRNEVRLHSSLRNCRARQGNCLQLRRMHVGAT